MKLTGRLSSDAVERGGSFLHTTGDRRYELVLPPGWAIGAGMVLRNHSGEVVAGSGDTITVSGELAAEMRSTRQTAPIFRVLEVVSVER